MCRPLFRACWLKLTYWILLISLDVNFYLYFPISFSVTRLRLGVTSRAKRANDARSALSWKSVNGWNLLWRRRLRARSKGIEPKTLLTSDSLGMVCRSPLTEIKNFWKPLCLSLVFACPDHKKSYTGYSACVSTFLDIIFLGLYQFMVLVVDCYLMDISIPI